jgi:hypothetical protein
LWSRTQRDKPSWKNGRDTGYFCADHKNKFDYLYQGNPTCDGYSFVEINVGQNTVWTQRLTETTTDPTTAAMNCQAKLSEGRDTFISCWTRQVATVRERQILDCVQNTENPASLAICASKGYVSSDVTQIADCSYKFYQDKAPVNFVRCFNAGLFDDDSAKIVNCAIDQSRRLFRFGVLRQRGAIVS